MGGINSGRRRSVYRGTVEQFPAIDLRVLKRAGLLRPVNAHMTHCAGEIRLQRRSACEFSST